MKTDKELADDLDARERIRNHGGEWRTCKKCNGVGQVPLDQGTGAFARWHLLECFTCNGKGGYWEMPMMRIVPIDGEYCQQLPERAQESLNTNIWDLV